MYGKTNTILQSKINKLIKNKKRLIKLSENHSIFLSGYLYAGIKIYMKNI